MNSHLESLRILSAYRQIKLSKGLKRQQKGKFQLLFLNCSTDICVKHQCQGKKKPFAACLTLFKSRPPVPPPEISSQNKCCPMLTPSLEERLITYHLENKHETFCKPPFLPILISPRLCRASPNPCIYKVTSQKT